MRLPLVVAILVCVLIVPPTRGIDPLAVEGFYDRSGRKIPSRIRGAAGGQLSVAGKSVSMLAYSGGPLQLKDYPLPVIVDLNGVTIPSQKLPTTFDHNLEDVVGQTDSVQITPKGIVATATIDTTAWSTCASFRADHRVGWIEEPENIETQWKRWTIRATASPKIWMDAYLAAFAFLSNCRLATTDLGFKQFKGLDLVMLT